jgi:hypothetical protein
MLIKKYDNSWTFKLEMPFNNKQYRFFVFLEDNLLVAYPIDEDTKLETWPLCVHAKHGIMVWDQNNKAWTKTSAKIQESYVSYMAEKILLEKETTDASI